MALIDHWIAKFWLNRVLNRLYAMGWQEDEIPGADARKMLLETGCSKAISSEDFSVLLNQCRRGNEKAKGRILEITGLKFDDLMSSGGLHASRN